MISLKIFVEMLFLFSFAQRILNMSLWQFYKSQSNEGICSCENNINPKVLTNCLYKTQLILYFGANNTFLIAKTSKDQGQLVDNKTQEPKQFLFMLVFYNLLEY